MSASDVARAAASDFGWHRLRPGQAEAMLAASRGRDVLAVLPTGAGKSAIYQVTGALRPGCTIVVSPLLSLQRDQIDALTERGQSAVRISSHESARQRRQALDQLAAGQVEFSFCSPEQLANPETLGRLAEARPSLVAIDEAHCVSSWGHDFRPDYLRIPEALRRLGSPPVIALTATASPPVREDIAGRLGLRDPLVLVQELDRPEITLEVQRAQTAAEQAELVVLRAAAAEKPAIVYCPTRRRTGEVAAALRDLGLHAEAYSAGLAAAERERVQQQFLDGRCDVIAATNAFGMGIDKPDIRTVLHAAVPGSPDSYFQEIGRAGRDRRPALALLVYRPEDLGMARYFAGGLPAEEDLRALAAVIADLCANGGRVARRRAAERSGLNPRRFSTLLNLLVEGGSVLPLAGGTVAWADGDAATAAGQARRVAEGHRQVDRSRIDMMRRYAEAPHCRRSVLLAYFGEQLDQPCDNCDRCAAGDGDSPKAAPSAGKFPPGARVEHAEWGSGTVMDVEADRVTVLFESVGYKILAAAHVDEQDLLSVSEPPPE